MPDTVPGSMPSLSPPANASPDSFSRTRFQLLTVAASPSAGGRSGADLEPRKPLERDPGLVDHLADRLLVVAHVGLVEQHDVLEEPVDPALDDLGQRLLGLALLAGGRLGDAALVLHRLGRDIVAGQKLRPQGRDLHRDATCGLDVVALELDE